MKNFILALVVITGLAILYAFSLHQLHHRLDYISFLGGTFFSTLGFMLSRWL